MKKRDKAIKKPPILYTETQEVLKEVQAGLDGDLLAYWVSDNSMIAHEDALAFYQILNSRAASDKLYLYIKSTGGSGEGALRIVHLLRQYYKEIVALVPLDCESAATMLVLGADVIRMGPIACLSAIDTSIPHELSPVDKFNELVSVSQNELDRVLRLWQKSGRPDGPNPYGELYKYVHPLAFGAVDRASSLSIKLTTEILSYHLADRELAEKISSHLNADYPSHSYPITLREAEKIGLNVEPLEEPINGKLLELNGLYSEMAQRAYSDFDEKNYHDNEILKIVEAPNAQLFYQKDKDWHYRTEERQWVSLNDDSCWRNVSVNGDGIQIEKFYIS